MLRHTSSIMKTKEMLAYVGQKVWLVSNCTKHMSTPCNVAWHGVQTNATCCAQQCRAMLCQHVAFVCTGFKKARPLTWINELCSPSWARGTTPPCEHKRTTGLFLFVVRLVGLLVHSTARHSVSPSLLGLVTLRAPWIALRSPPARGPHSTRITWVSALSSIPTETFRSFKAPRPCK